ncbi:MAG: peptidyl-prolyl cis-trans isomerase [Treponema sp.]|jgi:parvulin-like peptidyl-prolyl isomerase|nr:peptidyl-prolyl cis-trans isomerase [Treponema sp.]
MKRFSILLLLTIFTGVTVFAQGTPLDPTVAIVRLIKTENIQVRHLKIELEKASWKSLTEQLGRNPTQAEINARVQNSTLAERRECLDSMINTMLTIQAAERDRVTVTDNEVNQLITKLKEQMAQGIRRQPTDEEFALAIKNEFGQDLPSFRESLRRQGIVEKYIMSKKQNLLTGIRQPTEAEIVNQYNLRKALLGRPDTVRFSMIQVPYGPDAASRNRAKELADRLNRDIASNPTRFDEAVLRGRTPNAGYQAGDGGYLPRNPAAQQLAGIDFINTAFSLKHGEVSRVIEGNNGYQIIKITESYPMKALELDEIMEPGSPITVRQFIGASLLNQRQQEAASRASQEIITELRAGNSFQIMANNLNW